LIKIVPPMRYTDKFGSGHYGAPRGNKTHRGIDIHAPVNSMILSPVMGEITKQGFPYGDDLSFRYVEITTSDSLRFRFFYVKLLSSLTIGDKIQIDDVIGYTQDLNNRYEGITPHFHFEVKDEDNNYLDPNTFL